MVWAGAAVFHASLSPEEIGFSKQTAAALSSCMGLGISYSAASVILLYA